MLEAIENIMHPKKIIQNQNYDLDFLFLSYFLFGVSFGGKTKPSPNVQSGRQAAPRNGIVP